MSFWQTALIGYVSAGGLFFLVASILGRRNRKISAEPALSLGEKPDSPLLAALLVSSIWPLILGMLLHSWIYDRRVRKPVYRTLVATPDTLIDRLSLELIEQRETYRDPLGAVPAVPFGHLDRAWRHFRSGIREGDDIWSFSVKTKNDPDIEPYKWGEVVEGYAALRDGSVVSEFYTRIG